MRYTMKFEAVIDCPNDAAAEAAAKSADVALKNRFVTQYLHGQGIKLVTIKVDPKPTRE